jgi:O-antigen ligase
VCVSIDPVVSIRWFLQATILVFFAWSLLQLHISRVEFLTCCVLAIVPEAVLGIGQFIGQEVIGSKWLGISSQLPSTLGVSVVEVGTKRILRAYGGLPHPNILGGWLAFGLVAATQIQKRTWVYVVTFLFSVALVCTFSRSAWIAAALGLLISGVSLWRASWTLDDKLRIIKTGLVILVSVGLVGIGVRDILFVRVSGDARLEQKSTDERMGAIRNAWSLIQNHPVLGSGPNTAIKVLDEAGLGIVPPHLTFVLILLETGILGALGLILLLGYWIRLRGAQVILSLFILLPLALFDHYLWSLWAGQCLLMLAMVYSLTKDEKSVKNAEA